MFTLGEIIDLAIQIEKNGERIYRKAQEKISDLSLISMLQWLAKEEKEHEKWFIQLKKDAGTEVEDPRLEEMGKAILQSVMGDHSFSLEDFDFSKIEDVNRLIQLSIEFEKDTILFFEMISALIEQNETLDQLKKIIEEENRHVRLLEEFLE